IVQLAGTAALKQDTAERDRTMGEFRDKVVLLTEGLNRIDGFHVLEPTATFYVFPNVAAVCNRLGVTSHGLALFMLEAADDDFGIACLGGECFGEAGAGFLRFSCAEPNDRLRQALEFIPVALSRTDRLAAWLEQKPQYRLREPYPVCPASDSAARSRRRRCPVSGPSASGPCSSAPTRRPSFSASKPVPPTRPISRERESSQWPRFRASAPRQ